MKSILIGDADASTDTEKLNIIEITQFFYQRNHLLNRLNKGGRLSDLRAYVHLNSTNINILEFRGDSGVEITDFFERDAEFILVSAGSNFTVGACINIGIDPNSDRSFELEIAGYLIDAFQLGNTLNIKGIDSQFE